MACALAVRGQSGAMLTSSNRGVVVFVPGGDIMIYFKVVALDIAIQVFAERSLYFTSCCSNCY